MIEVNDLFKKYDSMSIRDLMSENYEAKKSISKLKIKMIRQMQKPSGFLFEKPFGFLFEKPPKSEPSILRQAGIIEIIESSPKIVSNEKKMTLSYDVDNSEEEDSLVDPEIIQQKLQEKMNINLNSMITNHNEEVHNIIFYTPDEASIIEYFPN